MASTQKKSGKTTRESTEDSTAAETTTGDNEVSADAEDVLDMIDEVLEENAEEFVKNYVQKGGE